MEVANIIVMLAIGIFGGFISGLVGIGGAIIVYPAILILPQVFGLDGYTAFVASGLTASQVFFSTLSGSIKARKQPEFSLPLIIYMGGGMVAGSTFGAIIADKFDATFINHVYIVIAILALILMMFKVKPTADSKPLNRGLLVIVGSIIGIISGIVGTGGAFIIIPILLALFKLSMNMVVTNSIVLAFVSSIGAFIIKWLQGYIPVMDALLLIIGSIVFAPIGLRLGRHLPNSVQKWIISILIIVAITQLLG